MAEMHYLLQGDPGTPIVCRRAYDGKTEMRRLISFVITLLMPVILVGGGGALTGWGLTNEWDMIVWVGAAMVVAGVLWGLFLFLWASNGSL